MRTLNTALLLKYVESQGKLGREILAVESKIPFIKIERLLKGTANAKPVEMAALCNSLKVSMDELFPLVETEDEAS